MRTLVVEVTLKVVVPLRQRKSSPILCYFCCIPLGESYHQVYQLSGKKLSIENIFIQYITPCAFHRVFQMLSSSLATTLL